jgi:hypothetical protein
MFPVRVGVAGFLVWAAFPQEDDVGDDRRSLVLERGGRQPDGPEEIGPLGEVLANGSVLLVQREMRGHNRQDAAGLQGVGGLGDEIVVDAEPLAVVVQLLIGERHVADHRVK